MSKREIGLLLEDILESANKISTYTEGISYDQFISNDMIIDATVRNFEIIGEASNRIPDDYKLAHPELEWRRMVGLRNKFIHEYFGIRYERLWQIKEEYLPDLIDWIETFIEEKP